MATLGTTLVQTTQGTPSATSSYALSLSQTTQLGNMIVAFVYTTSDTPNADAEQPTGVTDDAGNTYSNPYKNNPAGGDPSPSIYIWTAKNAQPATQITVTFHGPGTFQKIVVAREYVHEAVSIADIDKDTTGSTTGTKTVSANALANPDAILLALAAVWSATASPSWTNTGTFGNFLSITVNDPAASGVSLCWAIADQYIYNSTGATPTLQMDVAGSSPQWKLSIAVVTLEGGRKVVGDGMVGLGDGGSTGNIFG